MAHKFSLIFLGGSGRGIKQLHFSRSKLYVTAIVLLVGLIAAVYGVVDYFRIHTILAGKARIENQLNEQSQEVIHQRRQIQKFAKEINELKVRMVQLNKFEEQIRIIANIDQKDKQASLFGVGGSSPEDLDPNLEANQKHTQLIKAMHRQVGQLDNISAYQYDSLSRLLKGMEKQKNVLAHTPTIRPAKGWVSSQFGYRKSPFTDKREFHKGLDIANRKGTPIVATADGVVSFCGENGSLGQVVVIDHGHGLTTRYAHIDQWLKERGDRVQRGDTIALMGNTGRSTGSHLHYEVRLNGVQVNPNKYILN